MTDKSKQQQQRQMARLRLRQTTKIARESRGLTQEQAAERVGISVEFFGRIERGSALPSVPTLLKLAEVLTVSIDWLLGQKSHENART